MEWIEGIREAINYIEDNITEEITIEKMGSDKFEYLIADNYDPSIEIPNGFVTKIIPKHTWAVFPFKCPMTKSLQDANKKK